MALHRILLCLSTVVLCTTLIQANECLHPSVRREWRSISEGERADWIAAIKCLAKLPHNESLMVTQDPYLAKIPPMNPNSSLYDDYVYMHMDLTRAVHKTGYFLPWHRAYLYALEGDMKDRCGYEGAQPYWDWTMDAHDFYNSTMFDASVAVSGFGGLGDPNNDYQISDGEFSKDFLLTYPSPHTIRRKYNPQPWIGFNSLFDDGSIFPYNTSQLAADLFTKESQDEMVAGFVGDYLSFEKQFAGVTGSHGAVHWIMGGDMFGTCPANSTGCIPGNKWSSNDPLFFMHHAMVDKLWYDWQHKNKANFWSFHGGAQYCSTSVALYLSFSSGAPPFLNMNTPLFTEGIMPNLTIYDVMNTTGSSLCYVYE